MRWSRDRCKAWWNSYSVAATMVTFGMACGAIMLIRGGEIEVAKFFAYPVLLVNAPPVAMGLVLTALSLFLGIDIPRSEIFWWWMAFAVPFVYPYWRCMERGWRRHLVRRLASEIETKAKPKRGGEAGTADERTPPSRL